MHPYITERIVEARRTELVAEAEKERRAGAALRAARHGRKARKRSRLAPFHRRLLEPRARHS